MFKKPYCVLAALSLLIASCGQPAGTIVTVPDEAPDVSLADISTSLTQDDTGEPELLRVDPSYVNINPFKTWYSYIEREEYDYLLEQAKQDPEYLERSLKAVFASFDGLPRPFTPDEYRLALERVALIDVSARHNVMPVREAQWISDLLAARWLGFDAAAWAGFPERLNALQRRQREADYRKRTYLNYFLMREELASRWSPEDVKSGALDLVEANQTEIDALIEKNTAPLD